MSGKDSAFRELRRLVAESFLFKAAFIGILILVLIIPQNMIKELVHERMGRSHEAVKDIVHKWSGPQIIEGPVLSVPYKIGNDDERHQKMVHICPERLEIQGDVIPEKRNRGIFSAILYLADLNIKGNFRRLSATELGLPAGSELDYSKAVISCGLSDLIGVSGEIKVNANGKSIAARSGTADFSGIKGGFHIPIDLSAANDSFEFNTDISLRGSSYLSFVPSGLTTKVNLKSTWQDPSFTDEYLPNKRQISEDGFSAEWEINSLQRNFASFWPDKAWPESKPLLGVSLLQTNNLYQKLLRVIKYAILFISFTFAAVFICERLSRQAIHPLQYLLVGLASLFFYVFLLSLSEHIAFNTAYIITTVAITGLITAYSKGIFANSKMALVLAVVCTFLYLFLFGTLQMEDYALLMGSSGLLIVLAAVMYLTRGINKEDTAEYRERVTI